MKRLQISIDDDLEEALERRSSEEGVSKAALIRNLVRSAVQPLPDLEDDPLLSMVGVDSFDGAPVDDVVYR